MKNKYGFTMMELIITLTIVVILSLISWPIYRGHKSREYTMLAEGYALLSVIKEAQINYYNEYGNFLRSKEVFGGAYAGNDWTANDPVFGINAMNNKYFSWFASHSTLGNSNDANLRLTYEFQAGVASKDCGTIFMVFNLTQRNELRIVGKSTITL